ncbi:MAG: methyltransferase domain-containing protein [Coleofasciculus chthonoplastes F3-SA18-01]|uniref:methyltransferase domain-containing protein n=1 Tax=Coleofasciculus chthonoplastes TaxID=64178 RepID=UPI0032F218AA
MTPKSTQPDTEVFNNDDSPYQSFWENEERLHWGYFDNLANASRSDFIPACQRRNDYMLEKSGITASSKVLDLGCGNGNSSIWLAQQTGCEVIGVDWSETLIDNAKQKAQDYPSLRLSFQKVSVTNLPFPNQSFTHVWSQGTLYQVEQRELALREINRVLSETGILLLDDLITPKPDISQEAKNSVYQRLSFAPTFSSESYVDKLSQIGFMVFPVNDWSEHLQKSYELLSQIAQENEKQPELSAAYQKMAEAIQKQELGWSFYRCEKVSDRLNWIHDNQDTEQLQHKYNAWSRLYESDIGKSWQVMPMNAARMLEKFMPQKDISILDAGAGTGMVGEALVELGYKNITAIDLSSEMLECHFSWGENHLLRY